MQPATVRAHTAPRDTVKISEYDSAQLSADQLSGPDRVRLVKLREKGAFSSIIETRTGWRLTAQDFIGVINLDKIRLVIEPKFVFDGKTLMQWLSFARSVPLPVTDMAKEWEAGSGAYFGDLIVRALLAECRKLLRSGLRREYVQRDLVGTTLRGRIDPVAQATRGYGQLDRLHMRTFRRELETWENQACSAALAAATTITHRPELAHAAAETAGLFPVPGNPAALLTALERGAYHRLNQHYRPAHAWARIILRGDGISDVLLDAGHRAHTVLLRMNGLWEQVVRLAATQAAAPLGGTLVQKAAGAASAIRSTGDLGQDSTYPPDCLLRFGTRTVGYLPVDAKYKRYEHHRVEASDIHQLLTYAAGYAGGHAAVSVIVHPRNNGMGTRVVRVNGPHGRLGVTHVLGLDVTQSPEVAVSEIRDLLRSVLSGW